MLAISAVWTAALWRFNHGDTRRLALLVAVNLGVNLISFMTHPLDYLPKLYHPGRHDLALDPAVRNPRSARRRGCRIGFSAGIERAKAEAACSPRKRRVPSGSFSLNHRSMASSLAKILRWSTSPTSRSGRFSSVPRQFPLSPMLGIFAMGQTPERRVGSMPGACRCAHA